MKYLCECHQTKKCLQLWANTARLITAAFFFWSAGSEMQKSQYGLLQQLLFEILNTFPDWIPVAFPERWKSRHHKHKQNLERSFSLAELKGAFSHLSAAACSPGTSTKLCIFVDGLDEYHGDHLDLIQTIQQIATLENVKICVSSRPWNCFEDAFGQDRHQKLYLQDLTKDDIALYARDKLREIPKSAFIGEAASQSERLISEIVRRAEGVFLWVFLVTRSLREGLINGDSLSLLHERLSEIPNDLEEFFKKLILSVERIYRRKMAYTFQIALETPKPLKLLLYSFIEQANPGRVSQNTQTSTALCLEPEQISQIEESMERQLNGRYKGLLEAHGNSNSKEVDFLHRSVRDFLVTEEIQHFFAAYYEPAFNPFLCVCNAFILQAKSCPDSLTTYRLEDFLQFANKAERELKGYSIPLLEEMNRVLHPHTSAFRDCLDDNRGKGVSLLGKAIEFGHIPYVQHRLEKDPTLILRNGRAGLSLTLRPWLTRVDSPESFRCQYEMIMLLLDYGADPNLQIGDRPIIHTLLDSFSYTMTDPRPFEWYCRVLIKLLEHGAVFCEQFSNDCCLIWRELVDTLDLQLFDLVQKIFSLMIDAGFLPEMLVGGLTLRDHLLVDLSSGEWDKSHPDALEFYFNMIMLFLRKGANPFLCVFLESHEDDKLHLGDVSAYQGRDSVSVSDALNSIFPSGCRQRREIQIGLKRVQKAWTRTPDGCLKNGTKRVHTDSHDFWRTGAEGDFRKRRRFKYRDRLEQKHGSNSWRHRQSRPKYIQQWSEPTGSMYRH